MPATVDSRLVDSLASILSYVVGIKIKPDAAAERIPLQDYQRLRSRHLTDGAILQHWPRIERFSAREHIPGTPEPLTLRQILVASAGMHNCLSDEHTFQLLERDNEGSVNLVTNGRNRKSALQNFYNLYCVCASLATLSGQPLYKFWMTLSGGSHRAEIPDTPLKLFFNSGCHSVRFPRHFLDLEVKAKAKTRLVSVSYNETRPLSGNFLADYFRTLDDFESPFPVSGRQIGRKLGISERTFQRRLHLLGLSHETLQYAVRMSAIDLLQSAPYSGVQLSELLGYSEPSAFYRARKRWRAEQFIIERLISVPMNDLNILHEQARRQANHIIEKKP